MMDNDDKELDELLSRFGSGYNAPPENPPLDLIRARVHSQRSGRRRRAQWIWTGAIAASFALIAVGLSNRHLNLPMAHSPARSSSHALQESTAQANMILDQALKQAEAAAKAHPGDPFFVRHLETMRDNSQHFHELQGRSLQDAS